jgi:hypothetical protein
MAGKGLWRVLIVLLGLPSCSILRKEYRKVILVFDFRNVILELRFSDSKDQDSALFDQGHILPNQTQHIGVRDVNFLVTLEHTNFRE